MYEIFEWVWNLFGWYWIPFYFVGNVLAYGMYKNLFYNLYMYTWDSYEEFWAWIFSLFSWFTVIGVSIYILTVLKIGHRRHYFGLCFLIPKEVTK